MQFFRAIPREIEISQGVSIKVSVNMYILHFLKSEVGATGSIL